MRPSRLGIDMWIAIRDELLMISRKTAVPIPRAQEPALNVTLRYADSQDRGGAPHRRAEPEGLLAYRAHPRSRGVPGPPGLRSAKREQLCSRFRGGVGIVDGVGRAEGVF